MVFLVPDSIIFGMGCEIGVIYQAILHTEITEVEASQSVKNGRITFKRFMTGQWLMDTGKTSQ